MQHRQAVLITGGAGFIGSHICDKLIESGYHVTCMDNLLTGNLKNIEHLIGLDDFRFIKHDVTEYIHLPGAVHYILHFASPASPRDYLDYPIQTLKVGALGTHKTLGLAKEKRATFLLASTSEVYGDPLVHPQSEDYWGNVNPIGPRGVYDEAKRYAEAITMAYHRYHGVATKIARIFNTFGPKMRPQDGRAIPTFISQALARKPVTVFGDGKQTRSFCYISDLVEGILSLMNSQEVYPVNLGNPVEMRVLELAKRIIEITGSSSKIVMEPLPEDDPKVRQPDISKAKRILGWSPEVLFETGLKSTIDWFSSSQKYLEIGDKA